MRPRQAGFTLLEMVGVTFLSALVLGVAVDSFLDLSRQSTFASELTRGARRSVGALDRIARDLGSAVLVRKPAERDPLEHPWLFLGEDSGGGPGADRIKFVTRANRAAASGDHESDLAFVAYVLRPADFEEGFDLLRWTSPHLPEGLDRSFPGELDGAQVLLEGVARFGVRFQDEVGEWQDGWDSSTLEDSSELPQSVEIELALLPETGTEDEEPHSFRRRVVLPLRPIDLEALLEAASIREEDEEEEESDEDCITVDQCREINAQLLQGLEATDPGLAASIQSLPGDQCFSEVASSLPVTVEGCE